MGAVFSEEEVEAVVAKGAASGTTEVAWRFDGEGAIRSIRDGVDRANAAPFPIYSITKTMVATIALALHEVGRLHIDAPLADWFPDVPSAERVSLRMLLNHTSGYGDYGGLKRYHADLARHPEDPWTFDRYLGETILEFGTLFPPGKRFSYCNPGYMVVRSILEQVTDMTFGELLSYWIAKPLELGNTYVAETLSDMKNLTPARSVSLSEQGDPVSVRDHYHPGWVSHGLVISTPEEIVRFFDALRSGKIVTRGSFEEMLQAVEVPDESPRWGRPGYGLGLMVDPSGEWGRFYGHGGEGPGYTTFAGRFPGSEMTVCVMRAALEEGPGAEEVLRELLVSNRSG